MVAGILGVPAPQVLSQRHIPPVSQNSSGATGKSAGEFSNTTDGFDFRAYKDPQGGSSGWVVEAIGGPCRAVGIEGIAKTSLHGFSGALSGNFRENYWIILKAVTSSGNDAMMQISNNTNYHGATQSHRRQMEATLRNGADGEAYRDNYKKAECIEMNHMQYVNAVQNWVLKNETTFRKLVGK
jgi:hypothetical protein